LIVGNTPDQVASLRRELKWRREGGLEGSWLTPRVIAGTTGLIAGGGIGIRDGATLDPYRAAIGLAAAAARRGAAVFERSLVNKITFTRRFVEVVTSDGRVRARKVVIATGAPTGLFRSLVRHFWFRNAYYALTEPVPAKVRRTLGNQADVVRDSASPSHIIRWVDDDKLLVSGADGVEVPDRQRPKTIVQRTGQLMYELSTMYPEISGIMPAYGWHTPYGYAAGGLPYIGPHRNFPHHLFAFGDSSHGVTGAYLASRILLRYYRDEASPGDEAFAFQR
jgi:glycine/D-amino acid oxidase-like deaminating enzyme